MQFDLIRAVGAVLLLAACGSASAQPVLERGKYGDPNAIATVGFEFGRADLSDEAKARLEVVVGHTEALELVGHTDFTGDPAYNEWLAGQRARAVRRYLVSRGLARDKLTIVAVGEADPVDSNHSKIGRARNRRVDVRPAP